MNARQPKHRWKTLAAAVGAAIILTLLFASFFPWLALLCATIAVAGGIAYATWPPLSERLANLRSRPSPTLQRRIYISLPIVLYGIILLGLSQSRIRANWHAAELRAEVAREIEDAKTALEHKKADQALKICTALDSKANAEEKTQIGEIRARAQAIENAYRAKDANAKVLESLSDVRMDVFNQELDKAESALESALHTPMATEFPGASDLANDIVAARAKMATAFLDAGELTKAKQEAQKALRVPSATETTVARRVITDITTVRLNFFRIDVTQGIFVACEWK